MGRDPGGVIIRQTCQQARAENRQERQHPGTTTAQHFERPLRPAHHEVGPGLPVAARDESLPPCGHRARPYSYNLAGSPRSEKVVKAARLSVLERGEPT